MFFTKSSTFLAGISRGFVLQLLRSSSELWRDFCAEQLTKFLNFTSWKRPVPVLLTLLILFIFCSVHLLLNL